jgi:hypothetical protein
VEPVNEVSFVEEWSYCDSSRQGRVISKRGSSNMEIQWSEKEETTDYLSSVLYVYKIFSSVEMYVYELKIEIFVL